MLFADVPVGLPGAGGPHNAVFVVWELGKLSELIFTSNEVYSQIPLKPTSGLSGKFHSCTGGLRR